MLQRIYIPQTILQLRNWFVVQEKHKVTDTNPQVDHSLTPCIIPLQFFTAGEHHFDQQNLLIHV